MTIFKHLALAALCHADTFYTDPSKIDREAISQFRNLFERNFCSGNQSAPCQDEGGDKVCANDGWTYSSACDFKRNYCLGRRSLRFHHWGQCGKINDFVNDFSVSEVPTTKCVKSCTKNFRWVCGTDGESYPTMCHLEIATCKSGGEVQLASNGKCAIQGQDERPVIGNDGPDYEDEPEINLCDSKCTSREYSPRCGSDGVTYSSLCQFECVQNESGIKLKHHGKCRDMVNDSKANRFSGRFPVATEEEEEEICKRCLTKEIRYVCGTNGKTYNTECELNYDRCQFGVDVSREHYGPCADDKSSLMLGDLINNFLEESAKGKADEAKEEIETCENLKTCSPEKNPVCGEFRDVLIPYINTCYMKMFSCKLAGNLYSIRARGKPKRNTCKSNGRNKRSDDGFCLSKIGCPRMMQGMSNKGVCGSDGITYWNECDLKRANCESDVEISLVYNDRCEAECALNSMDINMQCGTNGLTYWNMCALKEFNYLNRATDPYAESISVAYPGPCSVTNVQMLNDFPIDKKPVQKEVEEQEYKYDEEEDSEDMSPYSEVNCRSRKEEHYDQPCNSFDHKSCYSDGKKYSLCQFRLAKCDDSNLVLAIDPQSCETY